MAAAPSEAEVLVAELESRLDRLRALYEQYFLGFEKLEPLIPRKDVDRRFDVIRRLHFRNTALRFKFNMLQQRYNTFQMYWLRICRQIEDGTYQRHLNKAKARAEAEKKTLKSAADGWDVDVDIAESPDDLFASFETAKTTPPSAPPVFTVAPEPMPAPLEFDDPFAASMPPPRPASEGPLYPRTVTSLLPDAPVFRPSVPPRISPSSMAAGPEKKMIVLRKTEPLGPRTMAPAAATIVAPPMIPGSTPAPAPPKAPPSAPKAIPKAPPSAPKSAPKAGNAGPTVTKAPPRPPPPISKGAPPRPAPAAISPPTPGPIPRVAMPPGALGGTAASKGAPLIRPKPPEGPRAPVKPDDDRKMRELYTEYVSQKQSRNEATGHLSYDAVAKSLKDSGSKLSAKHEGKRVDFEVALKDGVTVLRPVIEVIATGGESRRWSGRARF